MAVQQTFDFLAAEKSLATPPSPAARSDRFHHPPLGGSDTEAAGEGFATKTLPGPESPTLPLRGRVIQEGDSTTQTLRYGQPQSGTISSGKDDVVQQKTALVDQLRARVGCINTSHLRTSVMDAGETLSTGSAAIDELLPRGGLRTDAITEWVAEADGCGAAALSLITAANHLQSPQVTGPLVVVCPPDQFYPPAAVALGIPADRVIWVRPTRQADTVWAIDQALRSKATAIVWAPIAACLDDRDARRFQLAAENGSTPGLFIRPAAVRGRPTFADIRFYVSNEVGLIQEGASARVMRITLDRCRGGQIGRSVSIEINDAAGIDRHLPPARHQDETTPMHLVAQLSRPQRTAKQHKCRA